MERINTIGRRKTAVARVYMTPGKGNITVNNKDYKDYFTVPELQYKVLQALKVTETEDRFDIKANVNGGGIKGQAESLRMGLARALVIANEEEYKPILKKLSLLTRDSRKVERKKPGQPKARKKFQFSKR